MFCLKKKLAVTYIKHSAHNPFGKYFRGFFFPTHSRFNHFRCGIIFIQKPPPQHPIPSHRQITTAGLAVYAGGYTRSPSSVYMLERRLLRARVFLYSYLLRFLCCFVVFFSPLSGQRAIDRGGGRLLHHAAYVWRVADVPVCPSRGVPIYNIPTSATRRKRSSRRSSCYGCSNHLEHRNFSGFFFSVCTHTHVYTLYIMCLTFTIIHTYYNSEHICACIMYIIYMYRVIDISHYKHFRKINGIV